MLVYAIAIGLFLGAACLLLLFMHRALTAEEARYGGRAEQALPSTAAPTSRQELDRAA